MYADMTPDEAYERDQEDERRRDGFGSDYDEDEMDDVYFGHDYD